MSEQQFSNSKKFITSIEAASRCGFSTEYIAKLCRENKLQAKLVGRSWFIDEDSLVDYLVLKDKTIAPEGFVTTTEAAKEYGCSTEYISRLCREGKLQGFLVGRSWFVDPESLKKCMRLRDEAKIASAQKLSLERKNELQAHKDVIASDADLLPNHSGVFVLPRSARLVPPTSSHRKLFSNDAGIVLLQKSATAVLAVMFAFGLFAVSTSSIPRQAMDELSTGVFASVGEQLLSTRSIESEAGQFAAIFKSFDHINSNFFATPPEGEVAFWDKAFGVLRTTVASLFGKSAPIAVETPTKVVNGPLATSVPPAVVAAKPQLTTTSASVKSAPATMVPTRVVEKVVERQIAIGGTSKEYVDQQIEILKNALTSEIFKNSANNQSAYPGVSQAFVNTAQSQRIDVLSGVNLQNVTIDGISGLSDADIPDEITVSNYLPLSGGTLTGTLEVSTTSTSTFAGPIAVSALQITGLSNCTGAAIDADGYVLCGFGGGGGGADGNWTFFNNSGIRLATTTNQVLIGASATTSLAKLEVVGNAYIRAGNLGIGTSSPFRMLSVDGDGVFGGNLIVGSLTSTSTATSTFAGGIDISSGCFAISGVCLSTVAGSAFGKTWEITGGYLAPTTTIGVIVNASSTFSGGLTISGNATATSATTTSFFTTTASSTNLFTSNLSIGSLTGLLKASGGIVTTAVANTDYLTSSGAVTSLAATYPLIASAATGAVTLSTAFSTTTANTFSAQNIFSGLFATNASSTNATTTNLHITGLSTEAGAFLAVDPNGKVIATTTPTSSSGLSFGKSWEITGDYLTPTTTIGILVNASSTINGNLTVVGNATATNATSTNLYVGSTFRGAGLSTCSGSSDKLLWNSTTGQFTCGADAGAGGGITAIGPAGQFQTGSTQTLATSSDINFGLTITASGDTQTFTTTFSGTLADARVADNLTISSGTINNTPIGASTPSTAVFTNATSTNATSTSFFATTASSTNLFTSNLSIGSLTGLLKATAGVVTTAVAGSDYENPLTFTYPLTRSTNTISLAFGTTTANTWSAQNTFSGLFATNASSTNATSTNLSTTNASTTNLTISGILSSLLKTNTTGGVVAAVAGTDYAVPSQIFGKSWEIANSALSPTTTLGILVSASSTIGGATNGTGLTILGGATTTGTLIAQGAASLASTLNVSGLSTLAGFISSASSTVNGNLVITGNSTTTNATTTQFAISAIASGSLLKTTTGGAVVPATAGTDYAIPSQLFGKSWEVANGYLAPTTTIGIIVNASSTIGGGTNGTGLTINGAATTTLLHRFTSGFISSASSTINSNLTISGNSTTTNATTTNLAITNIANTLLKTNATGGVVPAVAGTDYLTSSGAVTSLTATYPLIASAATGAVTLSTAFSTTTANTFSAQNIFSGLFATNASSTNATTTNLHITGLSNSVLGVDSNGKVYAAATSTLYGGTSVGGYVLQWSNAANGLVLAATSSAVASGSSFGKSWEVNGSGATSYLAPTTTIGTIINASTTIGGATQTSGLTILGGATTTGSAYIAGNLGVGIITPTKTFEVNGTGRFSGALTLANVASCTGGQGLQTNGSGDVVCATITSSGASVGGGWTTNNIGSVTLATTTDRVAIGASSTPYAKLSILSGAAATTTLALLPASGQTANIIDIYDTVGNLSSVLASSGNLGLGTTSPYAKLSVSGEVVAANFTATTTSINTFPQLVSTNATATNATSTNFFATNASSTNLSTSNFRLANLTGLLKATNGTVGTAVAGSDYLTSADIFGKSWEVSGSGVTAYLAPTSTIGVIVNASTTIGGATNGTGLTVSGGATTTLLARFLSGLIASASSTIGSGTQAGGLTISGGATTTGSAYIAGNLGVGINTPTEKLHVAGNAIVTGTLSGGTSATVSLNGLGNNGVDFTYGNGGIFKIAESSVADTNDIFLQGNPTAAGYTYLEGWGGQGLIVGTGNAANPILFRVNRIEVGRFASTGNFGVGTTSPYAKLSVAGETVASHFTATTTATSTFPTLFTTNATTTNFAISGILSSLLKTTSSGGVVAAVAGTDYATPSQIFGKSWEIANSALSPTTTLGIVVSASSTIGGATLGTGLTISGGATTTLLSRFLSGFISSASSTVNGNLTVTGNATATNATTSQLAISSIVSSLLKTNATGGVVAAVAGTDYLTGANLFGKSWEISNSALAPTTTLGILVSASSTIGGGTNGTGLTILGGATTTGTSIVTGLSFLNGGLVASASSTVGAGGQGTGLTINGGATTTGTSIVTGLSTLTGGLISSASSTINGNLTVVGNATATNATTTAFFATTASSTNLSTSNLTIASLTGLLKGTGGVVSAATAGSDYENPLTFTYPLTRSTNTISLAFGTTTANTWSAQNTFSGLFATNASTTNATSTNFSTTNASTTNLTISGILSSLLKTNTTGGVVAAVAGTDYATPSQLFGKSWEVNGSGATAYLAPTSTIGIIVNATSTIGAGGQGTGLTINGGATTTGNAYIAGSLGIGTSTPYAALSVAGSTGVVANIFTATSTTATSTFSGGLNVGNGALQYDFTSGITSIDSLQIGNLNFDSDAGVTSWVDMPITSASANGTVQSYTANLNGRPMITVYGVATTSDVTNLSVGIGSTTPWASLAVQANGTTTHTLTNLFVVASTTAAGANTTAFLINNRGFVGIGTTSPTSLFSLQGNAYTSGTSFFGGAITATSTLLVSASSTIGGASLGTGLTISGGATTSLLHLLQSGFISSASSTINGNLTVTGNATATNATTSQFAISSIASGSILKTTTGGAIIAAVGGTDYVLPSQIFGKSWEVNGSGATAYLAPTSTIGIIVNATSTIGGGTNGTGLTILGGATTTGTSVHTGLATFSTGLISSASSTIGGATLGTGLTISGGATTSLLHLFQSGLIASASSTIGNGTTAGGLTINGGATTTGTSIVTGLSSLNGGLLSAASSTIGAGGLGTGLTINGGATTTLLARFLSGFVSSASSTIGAGTNGTGLTISGGATTTGSLIAQSTLSVSGLSTLAGFLSSASSTINGNLTIVGNATATNATTTQFAITSVLSSLLKTNATGGIVAAVAGTDYAIPSQIHGKSWEITNSALAPTTTLGILVSASSTIGGATLGSGLTISGGATTTLLSRFLSGLISSASSTIGSGTQAGGLTISGGATTTGNSYIAGNLGLGTSSPLEKLEVEQGNIQLDNDYCLRSRLTTGVGVSIVCYDSGNSTVLGANSEISLAGSIFMHPGGTGDIYAMTDSDTDFYAGYLVVEGLSGYVGVGSSSPFAKSAIHAFNGETNKTLFAIGSSTANATSTLFSVDNTGAASTTKFFGAGLSTCSDGVNSKVLWNATTGLFSCGTDQSGGTSFGKSWEINGSGATAYLAPTTTLGILVNASSTIGGGTNGTGLTILGGATTTARAYFGSNVGVGTSTPGVVNGIDFGALVPVHISTPSSGYIVVDAKGSASQAGLILNRSDSAANSRLWGLLSVPGVAGITSSDLAFATINDAGSTVSPQMTITRAGNVGIGTTTPNSVLSIATTSENSMSLLSVMGAGLEHNTVASVNLDGGNNTGWSDWTLRVVASSTILSNTGRTSIRITIKAGTAGAVLNKVYIGTGSAVAGSSYAFSGSPTQVTFNNGSASVTIGANQTKVSDFVTYSAPAGSNIVIAMYANGTTDYQYGSPKAGWENYYINSDDAATVAASGYTYGGTATAIAVTNIEASGSGGSLSSIFNISNNGRVGIGTSSPFALLSVSSPIGATTSSTTLFAVGTTPITNANSYPGTIFSINNSGAVVYGTTYSATGNFGEGLSIGSMDPTGNGAGKIIFNNGTVGSGLHIGGADGSTREMLTAQFDSALGGTILQLGSNTSNFQTLSFSSLGGTKMVIRDTGNVGIGTTSPYAKLSVSGEVVASHFTATTTATSTFAGSLTLGSNLRIGSASTGFMSYVDSAIPELRIAALNNNYGMTASSSYFQTTGILGAGGMAGVNSIYGVNWNQSLTVRLADVGGTFSEVARFTPTGRFGIGTTTPSLQFAVAGNGLFASAGSPSLELQSYDASGIRWKMASLGTTAGRTGNFELQDITNGAVRMAVNSSGNVGIGSSTPLAKLSIHANDGETNTSLFAIASSTSLAVSPLLTVNNKGQMLMGTTTTYGASQAPSTQLVLTGGLVQHIATTTLKRIGSVSSGTQLNGASGIYVQGNYAYVLSSNTTIGMTIIDISTPTAPTIVGQYANSAMAGMSSADIVVQGKYAYIVTPNDDSLWIIDVSNPASPYLVYRYFNVAIDGALSVRVQGKYAYIAAPNVSAVRILDISNPAEPRLVGGIADATNLSLLQEIDVQGNYVYTASFGNNSVRIIDVSDPTNPLLVGGLKDDTNLAAVNEIRVSGKYAYVVNVTDTSFRILDISNPASVTLVGGIKDTTLFSVPGEMVISGRYAYLATGTYVAIRVIDISSPTNPSLVDSYSSSTFLVAGYLAAAGKYLYAPEFAFDSLYVLDTGGIDATGATLGGLYADTADITGRLSVTGQASMNSLIIGGGGLFSQGFGAFTRTATTSLDKNLFALSATLDDNELSSITDVFALTHTATGTVANGIGTGLIFNVEHGGAAAASTTATSTARIASILTSVTNTNPQGALTFSVKNGIRDMTEKMRIDHLGRVGIGTTTPLGNLQIATTSAGQTQLFPNLMLTDTNAAANEKHWGLLSQMGNLSFLTVSDAYATTTRFILPNAGGFMTFASSTIGGGTNASGLTINGGATTTGNAYFANSIGIMNNQFLAPLQVGTTTAGTTQVFPGGTAVNFGRALIVDNDKSAFSLKSPTLTLHNSSGNGITNILFSGYNSNASNIGTAAIVSGTTTTSASWPGGYLAFYTSNDGSGNTERARFDANGRFGIGTTSPYARLTTHAMANETINRTLFAIASSTSNSTTTLLTFTNTGLLGIGTTSPKAKLSIQGSGTGSIEFGDWVSSNAYAGLYLNGRFGTANDFNFLSSPADPNLYINSPGGQSIRFRTANSDRAAIDDNGMAIGVNFAGLTTSPPLGGLIVEGDAGFGTSSPYARLSVHADASDTNKTLFAVASSTSNATTTHFVVTNTGRTGIGSTSPWTALGVTGTVGFSSTLSNESGTDNQLCIDPNTFEITNGNTTCGASSLRYKTDVETTSYGLTSVMNMHPVTFRWNQESGARDLQKLNVGFIAEEMSLIVPEVVEYNASGTPESIDYDKLTAVLAKAVQELNLNLLTIASTTASTTPESESFAESFFANIFKRLTSWFSDAANGIADFFAKTIHTENLCVKDESGETCITKSQLDALIAGAGASGGNGGGGAPQQNPPQGDEGGNGGGDDTEGPVITVNGANPAEIAIGDSYSDLGATVTDNVDTNLSITVTLDGNPVDLNNILIDTSAPGEHTIVYSATDNAGNTGMATRTVIVGGGEPPVEPPPAEEPPPSEGGENPEPPTP